MPGQVVRRLVESDAVAYRELRMEMLREHPEAFGSSIEDEGHRGPEDYAARMRKGDVNAMFGAFDGDELIGALGIYAENPAKSRHVAGIWGMYVRDSHRGQGLGQQLVAAAITHARTRLPGVTRVGLSVVSANESAWRLYERMGFLPWGKEPDALRWQGQSYDELHMTLDLEE